MEKVIRQKAYIDFHEDVTGSSVHSLMGFMNELIKNGYTEAHLRLSSTGGIVRYGLDLYHFLKSLPLSLSTYNINSVDSIANVVYLAGKRRYVNPEAKFMMHGVGRNYPNGINLNRKNLKEILRLIDADERTIAEVISANTELTKDRILRLFGGERFFSAQEAVELGIAHRIKEAKVPQGAYHQLFIKD